MQRSTRMAKVTVLAAIVVVGLAGCGGSRKSSSSGQSSKTSSVAQTGHATGFTSTTFVNAVGLTHQVGTASRPVIGPDDMAYLGGHIFVGFQNGVGSMGEASPLGKDSTGDPERTPLAATRLGDIHPSDRHGLERLGVMLHP